MLAVVEKKKKIQIREFLEAFTVKLLVITFFFFYLFKSVSYGFKS